MWVAGLAVAAGVVQGAPAPKETYPDCCPQELCALYYNECGEAYGGCFLDPACGGYWPQFTPPACPYGYTPYPDYDPSGAPCSTYVNDGSGFHTPYPDPSYDSYPDNSYPDTYETPCPDPSYDSYPVDTYPDTYETPCPEDDSYPVDTYPDTYETPCPEDDSYPVDPYPVDPYYPAPSSYPDEYPPVETPCDETHYRE